MSCYNIEFISGYKCCTIRPSTRSFRRPRQLFTPLDKLGAGRNREGSPPSCFAMMEDRHPSSPPAMADTLRETALIAYMETGIAAPTGIHGARNDIQGTLDSGSSFRSARNDGKGSLTCFLVFSEFSVSFCLRLCLRPAFPPGSWILGTGY